MKVSITRHDLEIAELEKRISTLEAALREIAEHEHCQFVDDMRNHAMGTREFYKGCGHTDGHRCAAEIARKALEQK